MDAQSFLEIATVVTKLKMYPYFDIANYVLMSLMVREDNHPPATEDGHGKSAKLARSPLRSARPSTRDKSANGAQSFARKHPWSCWVSTMMLCFAASIISNLMVGEAIIAPFKDHQALLTASIVWYLVNFSPFDVMYKVCTVKPVKLVIYTLKEMQRANKVSHGVAWAMKLYPGSYVIVCIIGIIKGSGSQYMRILQRLVSGIWQPHNHEFLNPSFVTKGSLLASIVFILERKGVIDVDHAIVYFCVSLFFIYFRMMALLVNFSDPFAPVENLFCGVFMGGMWDALRRAVTKETDAPKVNGNAKGAPKKPEDKKNE